MLLFLIKKSLYQPLIVAMIATGSAQGMFSDPTFEYPMSGQEESITKKSLIINSHHLSFNPFMRYVYYPIEKKVGLRSLKAPKYVQKEACKYAKAALSPLTSKNWLLYLYLKHFGYLTVYEESGDFFTNRIAAFYEASGGIFFRKDTFPKKESNYPPDHKFTLGHEIGHATDKYSLLLERSSCPYFLHKIIPEIMKHRSDNPSTTSSKSKGDEVWAQQQAVKIMYKTGNIAVLADKAQEYKRFKTKDPYHAGFFTGLDTICARNPQDKDLQKIVARSQKSLHQGWWPWLKEKATLLFCS